jgi:hypothetical protein
MNGEEAGEKGNGAIKFQSSSQGGLFSPSIFEIHDILILFNEPVSLIPKT